jgi:hypothetical protein
MKGLGRTGMSRTAVQRMFTASRRGEGSPLYFFLSIFPLVDVKIPKIFKM